MSQGLNQITLIGNLGADSELRHTQSERAVLNFRMATTETFIDKDGNKKDNTQWHNCVLWGPRAEGLSKYMLKGTRVCVVGRMEHRSYDDKDGNKRYTSEVNVQNVVLLDGSKSDEGEAETRAPSNDRAKASGRGASKPATNGKARSKPQADDADDSSDSIPF